MCVLCVQCGCVCVTSHWWEMFWPRAVSAYSRLERDEGLRFFLGGFGLLGMGGWVIPGSAASLCTAHQQHLPCAPDLPVCPYGRGLSPRRRAFTATGVLSLSAAWSLLADLLSRRACSAPGKLWHIAVFGFSRRWFWVGWLVVTGFIGLWWCCCCCTEERCFGRAPARLGVRLSRSVAPPPP